PGAESAHPGAALDGPHGGHRTAPEPAAAGVVRPARRHRSLVRRGRRTGPARGADLRLPAPARPDSRGERPGRAGMTRDQRLNGWFAVLASLAAALVSVGTVGVAPPPIQVVSRNVA